MNNRYVVTTEEMFRNYMASVTDILWESDTAISEVIEPLRKGNMMQIRQVFKEGFTPMLVPGLLSQLENPELEAEIEVTHKGKKIGVLIADECEW